MSSFRDKIYNYEVTPPADSWNRVTAALDESSSENKFPSRLYNLEVTPPTNTWEAVSNSLYEAGEKVVPIRRKAPMFLRYAAAAIFIGVVSFGILKWTNTTTKSGQAGTAETTSLKDTNIAVENNVPAENEIAKTKENQSTDNIAITKVNLPAKNNAKNASRINTVYNERSLPKERINSLYTYNDHVSEIADRYIMLMTPDGNIIRMSKKLSNLVCCVSGEEQDEDCKSQIKKWQKKLATSPINPSPGNFMDILELINSLDEGVEL